MKQDKIIEIELELLELKSRAKNVGYKNIIPKLPVNPQESVMIGFYKRLSNWKKGLSIVENPSGFIPAEVTAKKEAEFITSTSALAEHFNAQ